MKLWDEAVEMYIESCNDGNPQERVTTNDVYWWVFNLWQDYGSEEPEYYGWMKEVIDYYENVLDNNETIATP